MPSKKNDPIGPWGNYVVKNEKVKIANGETRGTGEKTQIYNGAKGVWVRAYDVDEDYGGPYKSMKELAAKKRWQDDMISIYGPDEFLKRYHNVLPEDVRKALRKERSKSKSPPRTFKSKRGGSRRTRRSSRK